MTSLTIKPGDKHKYRIVEGVTTYDKLLTLDELETHIKKSDYTDIRVDIKMINILKYCSVINFKTSKVTLV